MHTIQSIIFDFGGVLGSDANNWTNNTHVINTIGLSKQELDTLFMVHWDKLKIGQEDLEDYYRDILQQSRNKKMLSIDILNKLYHEQIFIHTDVYKIAKELKNNYSLYILANESLEGMKYKKDTFHLQDDFKMIFNSAELGVYKPQPEVFKTAIENIKNEAINILFIDDQEKNVMAAKELGMKTIQFINAQQLKEALNKFEILN